MTNSTDASNFMPRLETGNAELRAQLATAQEYLAKLERVAQENFAVYRRQGETCDALRADLATERRKQLHATDRIAALRELLLDDAVAMEDLREDWEVTESWARHWQGVAERKAAKVKRLKKQFAALAAEVERLNRENDALRAQRDEVSQQCKKAQADLDACNAARRVDLATYLRQGISGQEYAAEAETDGRERAVTVKAKPLICADDVLGYDSGADEVNDTGLTNRATDAALRRLAQQETI